MLNLKNNFASLIFINLNVDEKNVTYPPYKEEKVTEMPPKTLRLARYK